MGQSKSNKTYRTFVKGLITEADYLTYPENSSLDELNTVPSRKGNRFRRFGINYSINNTSPRPYVSTQAHTEFMWLSVAANAGVSYLVVQNGATLSFFDRSQADFASGLKPFSVNLDAYTRPGVTTTASTPCSFASGKGYLFVVGSDIEPLVVTYDPVANDINVTKIVILARDFEGVRDGLGNDEEPAILTKEHFYNLLNQGWVNPSNGS